MTYHQTIIVGNVGRDPELRYTQSGRAVCGFSVAVNETWYDSQTNEKREKTTWYSVSVWGPQGENANKYISKGQQVMVVGTVSARAYTNNNGEPTASLDLNAQVVRYLSGRRDDGGGDYGGGSRGGGDYQDDFSPPPRDMNDIPF